MFKNSSIMVRLLTAMVSLIIVGGIAFSIAVIRVRSNTMRHEVDIDLLLAAQTARLIAGDTYHDRISDASSISAAQFDRITRRYDELCRLQGLQYLWSVMLLNDQVVFTTASHTDHSDPASARAKFLEPHTSPQTYRSALTSQETEYLTFSDKWGTGRMVLVPAFDGHGRPYLFAASVRPDYVYVNSAMEKTVEQTLLLCAAGTLVAILICTSLARSLLAPIRSLAQTAGQIAAGRYDTDLITRGPREVVDLAQAFDAMRKAVSTQLEALRQSEAKYRALFEMDGDAVFLFNVSRGRIVEANEAACRTYGYSRTELLALSMVDLSSEPEKTLAAIFSQTSFIPLRWHKKKDGSAVPVEITPTFFTWQEQSLVLVSCRDITVRRQAEASLRESEARYRAYVDDSPVAIIAVDGNRKYLDANPAAGQLTGYSRRELLALGVGDLLHPDSAEQGSKAFATLRQEGHVTVDLRLRRKDGAAIFVSLSAVAISEDRYIGFHTDITERKHAEMAWAEAEERFRAIFARAADGILFVLPDDKSIRSANPRLCEMLGYSPEELPMLCVADIHPAESQLTVMANFEHVLSGELTLIRDMPMLRKDKSIFYCDINAFPMPFHGQVLVVKLLHDVTERVQAEEKAHWYETRLRSLAMEASLAEERERRRLAGYLHDEVCQLLSLAKIKLSLTRQSTDAEDRGALAAGSEELIDRANRSSRSLMLQLSHPALYDLGFVAGAEWLAEDIHRLYGIYVNLHTDDEPEGIAVPIRVVLYQSLRELLVNAAKHAGVGEVNVSIGQQGSMIRVVVEDQGRGFAPEEMDSRTNHRGFGLFSIRERLRNLGGSMRVRSGPDIGTTITMEVPLESDGDSATET